MAQLYPNGASASGDNFFSRLFGGFRRRPAAGAA